MKLYFIQILIIFLDQNGCLFLIPYCRDKKKKGFAKINLLKII